MSWTDPTTGGALDWANGLVVASTDIDLIREDLLHIGGSTGLDWIDWTPTVDQGGAVAVTVNRARYCKFRTTAILQGSLVVTGAGTSGNNIRVQGLPAAMTPISSTNPYWARGGMMISDVSAATVYVGAVFVGASATTALQFWVNADTNPLGVGAFSLGSSDSIGFTAIIETA